MALDLLTILQNAQNTDDQPIQFTDTFPRFTIVNWSDVKLVDKNTINASALSNNYGVDPNA